MTHFGFKRSARGWTLFCGWFAIRYHRVIERAVPFGWDDEKGKWIYFLWIRSAPEGATCPARRVRLSA